jgi:hypothetical protein
VNPSKDRPSDEFNEVLEQWISNSIDGNPHICPMRLKSHYKVDPFMELDNLNDAMDGSSMVTSFLLKKRINPTLIHQYHILENSNSQSGSSLGSVRVHSLTLFCTPRSIRCVSRLPSCSALLQALALVASLRLGL